MSFQFLVRHRKKNRKISTRNPGHLRSQTEPPGTGKTRDLGLMAWRTVFYFTAIKRQWTLDSWMLDPIIINELLFLKDLTSMLVHWLSHSFLMLDSWWLLRCVSSIRLVTIEIGKGTGMEMSLNHFHKHNLRHLPRFPDFFVTFRILSPSSGNLVLFRKWHWARDCDRKMDE